MSGTCQFRGIGADFVPVDHRIATFDNDGTLWCEQPIYFQVAFSFDRIKAMAPQHPECKTTQPLKAILDKDVKALAAGGEKGLLQIMAATHVSSASPGKDKESNWPPAPAAKCSLVARVYGPSKAAMTGAWKLPPLESSNP